jgi:hypothetical protein
VIRVAISEAAFAAIAKALLVGSEADLHERGERTVWLEEVCVDRLGAMRGRRELQRRHFADRRRPWKRDGGRVRPRS